MQPSAPTKTQLKKRRQSRQQRRVRAVKALWRFGCMSAILGGFAWTISRSDWKISKAEQIRVEGNHYLTDDAIRAILAIPYPKLIMELAPSQLTDKLIAQGSIASAKIDRGLLPPHLVVQVQDLPPIARILTEDGSQSQIFVDERGRQLPISSYQPTVLSSLPKLQVRLPTTGSCPDWTQLYQMIQTSPVAIGIIDCRDPQNLFLQTEIGKVRLGTAGINSRSNQRIQQLDKLRDWQQDAGSVDVDYLDLDNPDAPKLQLKPGISSTGTSSLNQEN
ncbi:MAG: FtsQ-type POTRA domain-containing protein [Chamaesiphon sp.]|nr:FtsQ-type POTRA domain-containing protein [Chamaesiphon sp.]